MKKALLHLVEEAIFSQVSDIHFVCENELVIYFRYLDGIKKVHYPYNEKLFEYLKFIANLDIAGKFVSQSGAFELEIKNKKYFFRFSYMQQLNKESGVLRILNNHPKLNISFLTQEKSVQKVFKKWIKQKTGFVLLSGPTGSGKTTTLHVLLEEIAQQNKLKIVSLEDPIEIHSESYLQMQINEKVNFTYETAIKHLMRQDPDVIVIGEIRDEKTAKMAFRAALSGHMVFSTIHAKSATEALKRFIEFGIPKHDIINTLTGITNQRLFKLKNKKQKLCIYEILQENEVEKCLLGEYTHTTIQQKILMYYQKGFIKKEDAQQEIDIYTME